MISTTRAANVLNVTRFVLLLVMTISVACLDIPDFDAKLDDGDVRPKKLLFIGIDGVESQALRAAHAPALHGLMAQGASTYSGYTQLVSLPVSGPGWASILKGSDPDAHGVVVNLFYPEGHTRSHPSFIARFVNEAGGRAVSNVGWDQINQKIIDSTLLVARFEGDDAVVASLTADQIRADVADLYFLHLDDVDAAGHATAFGADEPRYLRAIEEADRRVAEVLAAVDSHSGDADWMIIATTDHGGDGANGHQAQVPANQRIFAAVRAEGVPASSRLEAVRHRDFHRFVLGHFDIEVQARWDLRGRPLESVIEP